MGGTVGGVLSGFTLVSEWGELADGDVGADDVGYVAAGIGVGATVVFGGAVAFGSPAVATGALIVGGIAGGAQLITGVIDSPDPSEVRLSEYLADLEGLARFTDDNLASTYIEGATLDAALHPGGREVPAPTRIPSDFATLPHDEQVRIAIEAYVNGR